MTGKVFFAVGEQIPTTGNPIFAVGERSFTVGDSAGGGRPLSLGFDMFIFIVSFSSEKIGFY